MHQPKIAPFTVTLENLRIRNVVSATLTIGAVVLAFLLAYRFFYILLMLVIAIMLYLAIRPLIKLLNRVGINKRVGMIVGYIIVVMLVLGFLLLLIPMLVNQTRLMTERLPEYYTLLKQLLLDSNVSLLQLIASYLPAELALDRIPSLLMRVPEPTSAASTKPVPAMISPSTVFSTFFLAIAVFAMAYYWMRDRDKIMHQLLLFFPLSKRETVKKLIEEMEEKVSQFYQGQIILCTIVGGASFVAYWLIGLPYALILGAFAFVFEAVPMVGPLLGAVPAVLIALTISPTMTIEVIAINSIVQFLENNILVPRIMVRTVGVNPIVTVLAIASFTTLFGLPGALLAIPLAAIIQVLVERTIFHLLPKPDDNNAVATSPMLHINRRNRFSVMRLEAQDLANDIRKRMRQQDPSVTRDSSQIEESIESLADEFDQLLAKREASASRVRS